MTSRRTRSTTTTNPLPALDEDEDDNLIDIDLNPQVLEDGDEEQGDDDYSNASSRNASSRTASKPSASGLNEDQTLQLFLDVQENGGVDQCTAREIYNHKPNLYGPSGSALRRKFRNKVDYWKNNNRGRIEYNKRVTATGILPSFNPKPKPKPSSKSVKKTTKGRTPPATPERSTPVLKVQLASPSRPTANANPFQHHNTNMSISNTLANLRLLAINQQNVRVANWEMPERNGGVVMISILSELELKGFHRRAFILQLKAVDIRFILDNNTEWYKCFLVSDNEVVIQFPSVPWVFLKDPSAVERGRQLAADTNARHVLSDKVLRTGIRAEPNRQLTTMMFKFEESGENETEPIPLDNSLFSPNESNGRIKPQIIPLIPEPEDGEQLSASDATHVDLYYVIGIHEENPSRIEEPVSVGSNPLAAQLSRMGLGKRGKRRSACSAVAAPVNAPAAAAAAPPNAPRRSAYSAVAAPVNAPAPAPAAAAAPPNAPAPAPAPVPAPAPPMTTLVPHNGPPEENTGWDAGMWSPGNTAGTSSLQLALIEATNGTVGTEQVDFMDDLDNLDDNDDNDDNDGDSPLKQQAKRRAILFEGEKVWGVDAVANKVLVAFDEVNSEAVVAIHPITKESLTHKAVMDLVEMKAFNSGITLQQAVNRLNELGANGHQDAMDILFPTAAV